MKCEKNLMIIRGPNNLRCNPHINPQIEFICVLKGKMEVKVEHDSFNLQNNEMVLVLPYQIHQFIPDNNCIARVFLFSAKMLEEIFPNYKQIQLSDNKFTLSKEALDYVEYIVDSEKVVYSIYSEKSVFYCLVNQCMKNSTFIESKLATSDTFSKSINYILEHYNEKISLKLVSKNVGISSNTLSKTIKKYSEITFSQLITNIRLEHAKVMLLESEKTITDIAYDSGFGSLRSFNRAFSEAFHCTPNQYRHAITINTN